VNWKLKCLALHALANTPGSAPIYRWLQRTVTGRYLDELSDGFLAAYVYHVQNFLKLPSPRQSVALEFGSGRNLLTPLLLSAAGAQRIYAYDLVRLATVEQINHIIRQLRERAIPAGGQGWREIKNIDHDLAGLYRIVYCAPAEARDTNLPSGSVDFICSTSMLEHIPSADMGAILAECRRVSSRAGLVSFIIDYHDHYATADPRITRFNFYRYSRSAWSWFNPSNHYQNRMRHSDYEALFERCGFTALERRSIIPPGDRQRLQGVPLAPEFCGYSTEDLLALNGYFLLQSFAPDSRSRSGAMCGVQLT
jgi:methyltransferase family protein